VTLAASQLRGSYTPLVTPFRDGAIDYAAFEASVARQIQHGSHGIVVTGTTGEPTSLSASERAELFRVAVAAADGALPVAAATGSANQAETLELTGAAEAAGVDAVLVVTPAFIKPSQQALVRHFTTVASRTELPLLIYNIPGRAGTAVTAQTVVAVAEQADNLVGIKHASADLDLVTSLLKALGEEFRIFCGLESLSYPMLALGAAGLMNAVGNVAPRIVAEQCEAVDAGDHERALAIHRELFELNRAIFFDTNPVPLKRMLSVLGLGSDEVRPPLAPLEPETRKRIDDVISGLSERILAPPQAGAAPSVA
jgi:4-hydroxy-tetrahydrodipicolinate synthase